MKMAVNKRCVRDFDPGDKVSWKGVEFVVTEQGAQRIGGIGVLGKDDVVDLVLGPPVPLSTLSVGAVCAYSDQLYVVVDSDLKFGQHIGSQGWLSGGAKVCPIPEGFVLEVTV